MKDLGDSGQLEKDADALVLIYHPQKDESDRSPSKLLVKKNRDGAKGVVDVTFRREYVRFYQTEVER
jgi:replicative DNA helicase